MKDISFRYDLHLHSSASHDCRTSFGALISVATRRDLAGIAVTDHDTMDGVKHLQDIWPHDRMQLISGCERTLFDGSHVIGLFLSEPIRSDVPRAAIEEILDQGGLIYIPHPFRAHSGILGCSSRIDENDKAWILERCHIIEIYNSKCSVQENQQSVQLLKTYPKAYAASSDAHRAHEVGLACTEYPVPLSPTHFSPNAAYAPPAAAAARIADLRRGGGSPARKTARRILDSVGLLNTAKTIRDHIRSYTHIELEKYP